MNAKKLLGILLTASLTLLSPAPQAAVLVGAADEVQAMLAFLAPPRQLQSTLFSLSHADACAALAGGLRLVQVGISGAGQEVTVYHDAAADRYVVVRGSEPVRLSVTAQRPTHRGGSWLDE